MIRGKSGSLLFKSLYFESLYIYNVCGLVIKQWQLSNTVKTAFSFSLGEIIKIYLGSLEAAINAATISL